VRSRPTAPHKTISRRQLTVAAAPKISAAVAASIVVPPIVADAGEHPTRRFLEFFAATIRNSNTRAACLHAVNRFFRHHVAIALLLRDCLNMAK
jgi:hypothetical protein